ncbi:MAG TPA: sigma factor-like helix-turn-helix DNA-binding protein [Bacilli bacterium]|nr:sigma factor-like helix-turn-helix DNA-binding protein [Bacilli bacterium]HPS18929.1 sigma factor-like helix-turn-helix DNA-binding protein [Bacilli bacterium]
MEDIIKTVRYNDLLSLYQELLTPTQKEILIDYFAYDLSLGEIASNRKVSRSAIEDAINKGLGKLEGFESHLHLLEKKQEILKNTADIKQKAADSDVKALAENIERIIK